MTQPNIGHFAIHCDDVARAKSFYESVFGWRISPWGPPDYFLIQTGSDGNPGVHGDLQQRGEHGKGQRFFECTINVAALADAMAAVEANGGRIVMPPYRIEGVGNLAYFEDSEGNRVGIMQYDANLPPVPDPEG